ncbi:MAG: RAMP superfamily CRISPR-associated protein [Vulcanimicrobiota bacterium]
MNTPWQAFQLAYVTIELETAFLIGAGESDHLFDSVFVTDANSYPSIPGESLAGVMRHALGDRAEALFGFQNKDDGEASRIRVSFAHCHGQDDKPVAFRTDATADPVLSALSAGVGRDHVRIGKHGAVDQRGKFDELVVPAGARFTFEICLSKESQVKLEELVGLLAGPDLHIGGKTRRGLGRFKVVRVRSADFDLTRKEDLQRLARLPVALEKAACSDQLKPLTLPKAMKRHDTFHALLKLKPIGTWMIGGGIPTGREPQREKEGPWDRVPLSERKVIWTRKGEQERGEVVSDKDAPYLLPGSSIKGALRHRTAFHLRRLKQIWTDQEVPEEVELFGDIRGKQEGRPGCVFIGDLYVAANTPLEGLQHVSLDRFTQAPMDHLLYDELALGSCQLELQVSIQILPSDSNRIARKALQAALDDLTHGRLALGAGRGHGRFLGALEWLDKRDLLKEEALTC